MFTTLYCQSQQALEHRSGASNCSSQPFTWPLTSPNGTNEPPNTIAHLESILISIAALGAFVGLCVQAKKIHRAARYRRAARPIVSQYQILHSAALDEEAKPPSASEIQQSALDESANVDLLPISSSREPSSSIDLEVEDRSICTCMPSRPHICLWDSIPSTSQTCSPQIKTQPLTADQLAHLPDGESRLDTYLQQDERFERIALGEQTRLVDISIMGWKMNKIIDRFQL